MKVIVVGGGIMGLCAAWALRRAGWQVALYEQGRLPNPLASSFDQHRLIRYAYGAMTGYGRMVQEAYPAWDRLWDDLGRKHYHETGTLVVARGEDDWVRRSYDCLREMELPVEAWQPAQIAERLPFLDLASVGWGLFTPTGGVLFAERILRDLARHLDEHGVALHADAQVSEIDPARAAIRIADGRSDAADALVVAAGPWAPRLLGSLRGRVTPSRQVLAHVEPPAEHLPVWRSAPAVIDQLEAARGGFYAIPPVDGTGLKVGDHGFSLRGDPDREREATAGDADAVLAAVRTRLRDFDRYRLVLAKTCFYSVTDGERFIVEPQARAWVLAGFSGHGFKFGAVMGEALAETLGGRRAPETITAWAAGRA
jgi:glycine/D-amino acid oxidase-like deaminating enzyme